MLRNFFAVVKDAYMRRNPPLYILLFVFPLFLCLAMLSMFSAESPRDLPIGAIAEGGGELQGKLLRAIDATPAANVTMRCKTLSECASAMRSGKIYAFVYIPADLEKHALRLEAPAVTVYTNGQSLLTSKLITNDLRVAIGTVGAVMVKNTIGPPITTEMHLIGNPTGNYERFLGIGLVVALFHVIAMILGAYFFAYPGREKRLKEWYVDAAKGSMLTAYLGRFLPALLILGTELCGMLLLARSGMPELENIDKVILYGGAFLMVGTCMAIGSAFVGVVGEMRIALSVSAVVGGPAFAFCGQTFPLFAMPLPIRFWSFLLPITHFMQLQSAFFLGHAGVVRAFESFEILAGSFVFWFAIAVLTLGIRVRRTLKKEGVANV